MPVHTINMKGGGADKAWSDAASALAKAFTPDYKSMGDAKVQAAQAANSYAGADANAALARERTAQAVRAENFNSRWDQLQSELQNEGYTPDEIAQLRTEAAYDFGVLDKTLTPGNIGSFNLATTPFNDYTPDEIARFQIGAGKEPAYVNTIDPDTGEAVKTHSGFASGLQPVLPKTEVEGMQLQNPDPNAPPPVPGWEGNSMDAQSNRIIGQVSELIRSGQPVPPALQFSYNQAYAHLNQPKTEIRQGADGNPYQVVTPPRIPPGTPPPFALSGAPAPAGATAEVTNADLGGVGPTNANARSLEAPLANTEAPQVIADDTAAPAIPPASAIEVTPIPGMPAAPPKAPTEAQARYGQYANRISSATQNLATVLGYDINTGEFREDAWKPGLGGEAVTEYAPNWLRNTFLDKEHELYNTARAQALNPLMRADSGAAIPDSEYPRYYDQYIPLPGEDPATSKMKMDHLIATQLAFEEISQSPGVRQAMAQADALMTEYEKTGDDALRDQADALYKGIQPAMHAAKARILEEIGLDSNYVEQAIYGKEGDDPQPKSDDPALDALMKEWLPKEDE